MYKKKKLKIFTLIEILYQQTFVILTNHALQYFLLTQFVTILYPLLMDLWREMQIYCIAPKF